MSTVVAHELNTEHEVTLRSIFKIDIDVNIPDVILKSYWRAKRIADRLNAQMGFPEFLLIAFCSGHPLPGEERPNALNWVKEGRLSSGDEVMVAWRKREVRGVFKGLSSEDKPLVQLDDGTGEDRELPLDAIRLMEDSPSDSESTPTTVP